jgi:predicted dehydrogenase
MKIACDLDKDRLAHMRSLYPGLETTTEFDHVINDSETDAIVIATPVRFHYEMAKKSLEAGKHNAGN